MHVTRVRHCLETRVQVWFYAAVFTAMPFQTAPFPMPQAVPQQSTQTRRRGGRGRKAVLLFSWMNFSMLVATDVCRQLLQQSTGKERSRWEPPEIGALIWLQTTPLSPLVYHRSPGLKYTVAGNTHGVHISGYSFKEVTPSLHNETKQNNLLVSVNRISWS